MKFTYDGIDYDLIVNNPALQVYHHSQKTTDAHIAMAVFDDECESVGFQCFSQDGDVIEEGTSSDLYYTAVTSKSPSIAVAEWLVATHPEGG